MSDCTTYTTYAGVADCHGIESFDLKENMSDYDRTCRIMRAATNGQRHAVYYEATMSRAAADVVMEYLKHEEYDYALDCLKRVSVELRTLEEQKDLIHTIPNPDLDPYS